MATKQQAIAACKASGLMLVDAGDCIRVDAPIGRVLHWGGAHSHDLYTRGFTRPQAWDEVVEVASAGTDACDNPECDACVREAMSFDELARLYGGERLT